MSKTFWIFLGCGLVVIAILISVMFMTTKSNHVDLTGEILKVRDYPLDESSTLVVTDFRVTNPSDIPFVVGGVTVTLDTLDKRTIQGTLISKPELDKIFKYLKLLGPKYNDALSLQDRVAPHQTVDRTAGAKFELPESQVEGRRTVHIRVDEVDGNVAQIAEKGRQ